MKKLYRSEEEVFFIRHKKGAQKRGIDFEFTFEEWVLWWKLNLGPEWKQKRGRRAEQYVMARDGDKGPYSWENVKCITQSENAREQTKKVRVSKLTEDDVRQIYPQLKAGIWPSILARKYGVAKDTMIEIRKKVTWRHITDPLD